ncbi:hypothetical protein GQ54DRAFT_132338 [Martensiomyces pterosporus]|nr:hypothetical protein GQ54DRAFT_132338 [Martensiomyces pterosporus]
MRPDPHKQKNSRRYQAAQRSKKQGEAGAEAVTDSGSSQPADEGKESTAPAQRHHTNRSNSTSHGGPQFSRRKLEDNSWRYEDPAVDEAPEGAILDESALAAQEEEDVREFLDYLKAKSDLLSTDQSAVYFQLRSETDSEELHSHGGKTWGRLVEVPWDSLLADMSKLPIHELLGIDAETELPENVADAKQGALPSVAPKPQVSVLAPAVPRIAQKLSDLAPNINSKQTPLSTATASAKFKPKFVPAPAKSTFIPPPKPQAVPRNTVPGLATTVTKAQQPAADDLEAFLDDLI